MFGSIQDKFFHYSIRKEVRELYFSIAIKTFACSMIAIFEPIFLYNIFNSIERVVFFYVMVYAVNFFLLPIGGKIASKYGFEHSILYSIPFVIVYFFLLYKIDTHRFLFYVAPFALAGYKAIYWPAHHADLAHYGNSSQRGFEVSVVYFLASLINIAGPFIGGFIIAYFGFNVLFIIISVLIFSSTIPLLITKEKFIPAHLSYKKAIRRFFKPYGTYTTRAKLVFMGYGADFIAMICWPIFIFTVVKDYKAMGVLITLSLLITAIASLAVGKAIDKREGGKVLKISVILSFFTWVFRYFFPTMAGVFVIDFLDRNITQGIFLPIRTFTYSEGKKRGYLKYAIFAEMGLSFGKVAMGILLILILAIFNHYTIYSQWLIMFLLAGGFSLFYLFLPKGNAL